MSDGRRSLVAGVDSSTQSTKVVACDAGTGEVLRQGSAIHPNRTEVHPDCWWDGLRAGDHRPVCTRTCRPSLSPASSKG